MTNCRGLGTARGRRTTMLMPARLPRDGGSVSHLIRTALVASVRKEETPMNWKDIAIGLGRVMSNMSRARRSGKARSASQAIRTAGLVASLVLAVTLPAGAGQNYPAPGFFADGLTPQSRWEEILKRPAMKAEFPMLGFGHTFAPITAVCVDGDSVRIADPRIDNGVRLSAERIRAAGSGVDGWGRRTPDRSVRSGPSVACSGTVGPAARCSHPLRGGRIQGYAGDDPPGDVPLPEALGDPDLR